MVQAYEAESAVPPGSVLPGLASALEVTIDELFGHGTAEPADLPHAPRRRPAARRFKSKKEAPPTSGPEGFGRQLGELRRARGMSQEELGAAAGISQRMVAYYETQRGNPSATLLARFADVLGVGLDELVGRQRRSGQDPPRNLRLWKQLRGVEQLSPDDRKAVVRHIEGLLRRQSGGGRKTKGSTS
jgi:transcriptional regulator with XRE-family HTH domain